MKYRYPFEYSKKSPLRDNNRIYIKLLISKQSHKYLIINMLKIDKIV